MSTGVDHGRKKEKNAQKTANRNYLIETCIKYPFHPSALYPDPLQCFAEYTSTFCRKTPKINQLFIELYSTNENGRENSPLSHCRNSYIYSVLFYIMLYLLQFHWRLIKYANNVGAFDIELVWHIYRTQGRFIKYTVPVVH